MKLFLKRLFFFIIPIAIFLFLLELTLQTIPNHYSYKNDLLRENANDIEVLVLGSSQSLLGINPKYFTNNGFNAAHLAQSLKYDYLIFNKYRDELKNLKVLVLPISYFSLFYRLEDSKGKWRIKNYSLYYNFEDDSDFSFHSELFGKKPSKIFHEIYNYMSGERIIYVSESGFCLQYDKADENCFIFNELEAVKRHTNLDLKVLKDNIIIINKFIKESKEMGVNVILFTPPARKKYIDNLDKRQVSLMMKAINGIVKLHNNVEYYNFLGDPRFKDTDLLDADHLTGVGAKKLTEIIDDIANKSDSIQED